MNKQNLQNVNGGGQSNLKDCPNNRKKLRMVFCAILLIVVVGISYAFSTLYLEGTRKQVITAGTLSLELDEDENNLTIENAMPMYDEVGMIQEAFTFRLINDNPTAVDYTLKLEQINTTNLSPTYVKYGLEKNGKPTIDFVSNIVDNVIDTGTIKAGTTIEYTLRLWIDWNVEDETLVSGKTLSYRINIEASQPPVYTEDVLNGTDPVLTDNLVPVIIADDGTVTKVDVTQQWYDYETRQWANAVVLKDNTQTYNTWQIIQEENIESYFVWIPRYRYKIFDLGNYTSVTVLDSKAVQTIEVEFESKDVEISTGTTLNSWLTHPAFTAFDTNGMWVGKFETGYNGATSTTEAQVDSFDSSKIIIKPNVYSWRNITVGNAFKASYDYLREEDSHMMKNTEWGAVAYLQHSIYGSGASVRVNNNISYLTGYAVVVEPTKGDNNGISITGNLVGTATSVTLPYNTTEGYTASTTGNISGLYDMSGGAHEYVMGYTTGATSVGGFSGLSHVFFDDDNNANYYDKYSATTNKDYNDRILGDATGEMGPYYSEVDPDGNPRTKSSWYKDYALFIHSTSMWFVRGGSWYSGTHAGVFCFTGSSGVAREDGSYRVVLTP